MRSAKISGKVGIWMAAFLNPNMRKQAVSVERVLSSLSLVLSGVPQGTVTAPVIFLLMIADIAHGVSASPPTLLTPEQSQEKEEQEEVLSGDLAFSPTTTSQSVEQESTCLRVSSFVDDTRIKKEAGCGSQFGLPCSPTRTAVHL